MEVSLLGTLFLTGGGDKQNTEKFDQEFLEAIGTAKPLLYIPVAMKNLKSYEECYQWVQSVFIPLGIQEIVMWTDLNQKSLEDLKAFSAVYIGGGNTFSLLKDVRNSNFEAILKEYVNAGGILYGGSAGAIILGSDILTCSHLDANDVKIEDFKGLHLIGQLAIWCHYSESDDELIHKYIEDTKKPVLALSEETGAYIRNGHLKVTGKKPAFLFKEGKVELLAQSESGLISGLKYDATEVSRDY